MDGGWTETLTWKVEEGGQEESNIIIDTATQTHSIRTSNKNNTDKHSSRTRLGRIGGVPGPIIFCHESTVLYL